MPEFDMADVKPTILSALTVFLLVLITVPLAKVVLNKYQVPGLTNLVNAV